MWCYPSTKVKWGMRGKRSGEGGEGGEESKGEGKDKEQMLMLGRVIKQKVLTTIQEEQRPGGLLAR